MASLVDAAGFGPKGTYSIALQTTKRPYGVTQLGFDVKTLAMDKTNLAAYVKSNDD